MNTDMNPETLIIALIALGVGIILGVLLARVFSGPARQKRHVSEELRQNMESSASYRHEVTEHFVKTSELIKNLTGSYAELHQYLADSAGKLTTPETGRQLAEAGSVQLELILPTTNNGDQPQAPRDYAPGNGVLSEDYGLGRANPANEERPTNDADFNANEKNTEDDPTLKVG
ncbi:MAG: DUF1043 family protein [Porticoccaceae bacterium]|nr:DUF1043 family protein [Porticoccaceae bacterium]